jgi:hypothetical protein
MIKTTAIDFAQVGTNLGWKAGLILSSMYAILGILVMELLGYGVGFFSFEFYDGFPSVKFVAAIFATIITIAILAIAPATVIRALTGRCLSVPAKTTSEHLSKYLFILLCVVSCLIVVILIHIMFQVPITLSFQGSLSEYSLGVYESYSFSIGIPSVIYILTGGWIGWKIYSKASDADGLD